MEAEILESTTSYESVPNVTKVKWLEKSNTNNTVKEGKDDRKLVVVH